MQKEIQDKVTELHEQGFCILRKHFDSSLIEACRETFWPILISHLETRGNEPNRGVHRYYLPMPFDPPCFAKEFFFNNEVLEIIQSMMGEKIVADQWGCDVPLRGSDYQDIHVDYKRPLFSEKPDLLLPPYILVVSFGLTKIGIENGPIEIAPGSHRMLRETSKAIKAGQIELRPVTLDIGDVLIRHPWALHRGTPNLTDVPRVLASIRYVRHWYADASREVNSIPDQVWNSLTFEQQKMMRFPNE